MNETKLYPGQCPECGDIHDPDGTPDEHGNRFVEEKGLCSNCVEEGVAERIRSNPNNQMIAREVAQDLVLKALEEVTEEIQTHVVNAESDAERAMWVSSRDEVRAIAEIAAAPSIETAGELFQSDVVSKRRKAVLELWNRGTMTQSEIAEFLNASHYNVRQDLSQFRKKGYYVRPTAWTKRKEK